MAKPIFKPAVLGNLSGFFDPVPPPSPNTKSFTSVTFSKGEFWDFIQYEPPGPRGMGRSGIWLKPAVTSNKVTLTAYRVEWGYLIANNGAPDVVSSIVPITGIPDSITPNSYPIIPAYEFVYFDTAVLKALISRQDIDGLSFRRAKVSVEGFVIKTNGILQNSYETLIAEPFPNSYSEILRAGDMPQGTDPISFAVGFTCPPIWPPDGSVPVFSEMMIQSNQQNKNITANNYYATSLKKFSKKKK